MVYTHFGEGEYAVTEHNIRVLLGSKSHKKYTDKVSKQVLGSSVTPETYLGSSRSEHFANAKDHDASTYQFHDVLQQDFWALEGEWQSTGTKYTVLGS